MSKKASLFYLYGLFNAGDAAIGLGALSFLEKRGYDVVAFSRWVESFDEFKEEQRFYSEHFPKVAIKGGLFSFRRNGGLISRLRYYFISFLLLFSKKHTRDIKDSITDSDVVILNGGNLMRCQSVTDLIRLFGFIYPLLLAKKYCVPYVILPQSTTKINWVGLMLLRPIVCGAKAAWLREKISLQLFSEYFPDANLSYSPDMAFHIPDHESAVSAEPDNGSPINVAMTFRAHSIGDIEELGSNVRDKIVKTMLEIVHAISSDFTVNLTLVVQCGKDLQITECIFGEIQNQKYTGINSMEILETTDTYTLLSFYKKQDLLVGMRLHSIILALSRSVPCVGLFHRSWGLKNPGLLSEFDLPFAYIDDENEDFVKNVSNVIKDRHLLRKDIQTQVANMNNQFKKEFDIATSTDSVGMQYSKLE